MPDWLIDMMAEPLAWRMVVAACVGLLAAAVTLWALT